MENNNQMVQAFNKAIADSGIQINLYRDDMYCEWEANVDTSKHDKQIRAEVIDEFRNKLFGKLVRLTLSMWNFKLFDDILQETYKELKEQNK